MQLESFRIYRYRSIRDSGWLPFSRDGITALVGQNESGKSSILDGLSLLGVSTSIDADDFRLGEDFPEVLIRMAVDSDDIDHIVGEQPAEYVDLLREHFNASRSRIELRAKIESKDGKFRRGISLSEAQHSELTKALDDYNAKLSASGTQLDEDGAPKAFGDYSPETLSDSLWDVLPNFVLFRESNCQLPNRIDLVNEKLVGEGRNGARNFLNASNIQIEQIIGADPRTRSSVLSKSSRAITSELNSFWTQLLGATKRIRIECEMSFYGAEVEGKSGLPYLAFWVFEGSEKFYPSQRSKGTRWFISFFLQLLASRYAGRTTVFLLDEPGAYLHATAQRDVVRLIEYLAKTSPVIYATHSSYLIDGKRLDRVLAVEREDEGDESITKVRRGMELASASSITLAPVLALIGVDFSQQDIIKKDRNVILEEVSGFFYMMAFANMLHTNPLNFIAAGGVDNVKLIVDLFVAWGIKHCVLVDDDPHGKKVCREIKAKWCLEDDDSSKRLLRIDGCDGIEDIFEPAEFRALVSIAPIPDGKNSEAIKKTGISKPIIASEFHRRVLTGQISIDKIHSNTLQRMKQLFEKLEAAQN